MSGRHICASPRMRNAYSPPDSSALRKTGTSPKAWRWRSAVSLAISSSPTPSTWVCVPEKNFCHEGRFQSDGIENLRAAIGLIGGDAHFGHHLQQPFVDRLDIALHRLVIADRLVDLRQHRLDGLERQIRVDRLGAIAGQRAELVHLIGLARLDHQPDRGAQTHADQMMMHGRGRQQRRDRDALRAHRAVGNDDDVVAVAHRLLGLLVQPVERRFHARGAQIGAVADVERDGAERHLERPVQRAQALDLVVRQDRLMHFQALQRRGAFEVEDDSGAVR